MPYDGIDERGLTAFPIPLWDGFVASTPVIPKMYWDVYSAEQRWKEICKNLHKVIDYAQAIGVQVNINTQNIKDLQNKFDEFMRSGFFDYYADLLEKWIADNMAFIWSKLSLLVIPGLTDDGYFCLYVPASWSEIMFDTVAEYADDNYGCLVLRY